MIRMQCQAIQKEKKPLKKKKKKSFPDFPLVIQNFNMTTNDFNLNFLGAQWLSGRVLDSRPRGRGFEPHQRLEQGTLILA